MNLNQIFNELKKAIYKPVYWLEGEEEFFIDQVINYAEHKILTENEVKELGGILELIPNNFSNVQKKYNQLEKSLKIKKQQAYKPGPVITEKSATAYHLSRPGLTARLHQPTHPDRFPKKPGSEQLHFRDLFGLSTPEVYRDPGRPEKP